MNETRITKQLYIVDTLFTDWAGYLLGDVDSFSRITHEGQPAIKAEINRLNITAVQIFETPAQRNAAWVDLFFKYDPYTQAPPASIERSIITSQ